MKYINLQPAEVITTRDFPVHSTDVLNNYFEMYKSGSEKGLPPVPLVSINSFFPYFKERELKILQLFLGQNPDVRYFLMNGSHRTTCAYLTKKAISGMVLEETKDISLARQIKSHGEPYEHGLLDTIDENILDMVDHFRGTHAFETVEQKTLKMVKEKVIPTYMIEYFLD